MLISVVLPTHNRPELLREAVQSVFMQSYPDWELIIVDDGSEPPVNMSALLDGIEVRPVRLVRNQTALGLSAARNAGMNAASGEIITFLDDDDVFAQDALKKIQHAFVTHASLECLFVNVDTFGKNAEGTRESQRTTLAKLLAELDGSVTEGIRQIPSPPALFQSLLRRMPMAFQRVAVKKEIVLSRLGGYTGREFGDLEWNYRLALRCECALLETPVYLVRCEGQNYFSLRHARAKMLQAMIKIRHSLLSLPEVAAVPELVQNVRQALAQARFEKAFFAYVSGAHFPWSDFRDSLQEGVTWRHISLLLKVLVRPFYKGSKPFD